MPVKRPSRIYRCDDCGEIYKSQGIGPHQRSKGHSGKTEIIPPGLNRLPAVPATTVPATSPVIAPPSMAAPDLALRLLPFSLYEDEHGNRYIVLEMDKEFEVPK